jgi:hypothetical protein
MLITAAVIAGGSQGSLKLFRDVFKIQPEVEKEMGRDDEIRKEDDETRKEIDRLRQELNNLKGAGGRQ